MLEVSLPDSRQVVLTPETAGQASVHGADPVFAGRDARSLITFLISIAKGRTATVLDRLDLDALGLQPTQ